MWCTIIPNSMALGGRFAGLRLGCQDRDRPSRLFNCRHRRFRSAPDGKRGLRRKFSHTEEPHPIAVAPQQSRLHQRRRVDRGAGIELAGIDRGLHAAEIDLVQLQLERRVLEAALGQPAMQRHLAALETLDAHARARSLALATAAAGLAGARSNTAAYAAAILARALPVGDFV